MQTNDPTTLWKNNKHTVIFYCWQYIYNTVYEDSFREQTVHQMSGPPFSASVLGVWQEADSLPADSSAAKTGQILNTENCIVLHHPDIMFYIPALVADSALGCEVGVVVGGASHS